MMFTNVRLPYPVVSLFTLSLVGLVVMIRHRSHASTTPHPLMRLGQYALHTLTRHVKEHIYHRLTHHTPPHSHIQDPSVNEQATGQLVIVFDATTSRGLAWVRQLDRLGYHVLALVPPYDPVLPSWLNGSSTKHTTLWHPYLTTPTIHWVKVTTYSAIHIDTHYTTSVIHRIYLINLTNTPISHCVVYL
jgi:hypothetical protein